MILLKGSVAYTPSYLISHGSGPILLVYSSCYGNEESILDCVFALVTSSCTHADDAAVKCIDAKSE